MSVVETILETYPELTHKDFIPEKGVILVRDDGDGIQYLAKWDYEKPIPAGLKLGKD